MTSLTFVKLCSVSMVVLVEELNCIDYYDYGDVRIIYLPKLNMGIAL